MAARLPAGLFLDGRDCVVLNDLLCWAVAQLVHRGIAVPARATGIVEEVRRAAIDFRDNPLIRPAPETVIDSSGFAAPRSRTSERLSVTETARLAGVSQQFVRHLARKGVLNGVQSGNRGAWRLDPGSVAVWIAERNHDKAA